MAIAPTPPPPGDDPKDGDGQRRVARKSTARKPDATPKARKPVAKPAAKGANTTARTVRTAAPKSRTEQVREAVTERIVNPARHAAEAAAEAARGAAHSARETIGNAASQSSGFSLKMIEHAEQNAREAFNAMRAAAKSKDVGEVLKVQGEYLREQGARSLAQAREVGDLIAQFGRDAIAPLTGRRK